ncbi:MAG: SagB/ThcOx family dehydrogenase, partial [Campylobacterota bacterium]|nr:SagB/ThcOx family dehydrogenase [Campylobacterota bacterium]
MNPLETVFHYHDRTKHRPSRYAASLGYMDWATQPDPFRSYSGSDYLELPLSFEHSTPPYHLIFEEGTVPKAPLHVRSISQLFQFSLGIALWKSAQGNRWALRCNASSGNLQPTEAYIIAPPIEGISTETTVSHYAPKTHGLEVLNSFSSTFWSDLPQGSFLVSLSSIVWREAWKYGER